MSRNARTVVSRFHRPLLCALSLAGCAAQPVQGATPTPAAQAGYTEKTFSVTSFDASSLDLGRSYKSGYKFYPTNLFSGKKPPSVSVDNGIATASGNNGALTSAACADAKCTQFVGTAFGGGAYIEIEVAYDENKVVRSTGWPSVWALGAESIFRMPGYHWAGQPTGYNNSIEVDMLEHHLAPGSHAYGAAVHNWFGVFDKSCPGAHYCQAVKGGRVDLRSDQKTSDFHKVGMLWTPASDGKSGSIRFYYDGQQVGPVATWQKYVAERTKPPLLAASPSTFGVIDNSHLVLLIGAGQSTPIKVRSVNVWQKDAASNLQQ